MKAQEGRDQRGIRVFHVLGAAAVEIAAFLDELEGVSMPVGRERLNHIHVAEKQDGFFGGRLGGANSDDQVLLARVRTEKVDVVGGEASGEKALLHRFGAGGDAALWRVGGVDLD